MTLRLAISLRLWLAKVLLPTGYAIWTYGQHNEEGVDWAVVIKELPDD